MAVESAVFYEDFVGSLAGYDDSGEIDAGYVAFERCWVAEGATVVAAVELYAELLDEIEVGMIAGEGEDEVVFEGQRAFGRGEFDFIFGDVGDSAVEVRLDLAVFDAVVDIGKNPVFDVLVHLRAAMDEGDARAVAPEVERSDGGGVFAADDEHVQAVEGMRLVVVVADLVEVFAGDAEVVGQIVVAGCHDEPAGAVLEFAAETVGGVDGEVAFAAGDSIDVFVLTHVEAVVIGDLAVVLEGFAAVGLLIGAGEGHVADLEQLRCGEEDHVCRVVEERIAEAALIDEEGGEAGALGLDGAGEAGWACANYEEIYYVCALANAHVFNLTEGMGLAIGNCAL